MWSRCCQGFSNLKVNWVMIYFQAHSVAVRRVQFLKGCWNECLGHLLADGQRLLSIPCHVDLSIGLLIT